MATAEVIELRLENYAANAHKFYRVYLIEGERNAITQWGRIGSKGQFKYVSIGMGRRKVDEKVSEGYDISTPWTRFDVSPGTVTAFAQQSPVASDSLASLANQAIGSRVAPPQAKTEEQAADELAAKLLSMAGKYRKPEATAPAAEPETPKADPNSVEGRLGAALAAARDAS
jgi:predicted DNA-binding WGR domain protein